MTPLQQLDKHRRLIRELVHDHGIRHVARIAGLNPMRVSRFVNGDGADDVVSFYLIAGAVGVRFLTAESEPQGNQVAIALAKFNPGRSRRKSRRDA